MVFIVDEDGYLYFEERYEDTNRYDERSLKPKTNTD
jgi:hypothetical protein